MHMMLVPATNFCLLEIFYTNSLFNGFSHAFSVSIFSLIITMTVFALFFYIGTETRKSDSKNLFLKLGSVRWKNRDLLSVNLQVSALVVIPSGR